MLRLAFAALRRDFAPVLPAAPLLRGDPIPLLYCKGCRYAPSPMTQTADKIHRHLLACLTRPVPADTAAACDALSAAEWQELRDIARIQRISALFHTRLHRFEGGHPQMPPTLREELATGFRERTMHNLFLFAEFRKIAEALQARDIPVVVLKGMHLAAAVYGEIGMREMEDMDILVPRDRLQAAADTLGALGYVSKEPLDVEFWAQKQHHLPRLRNASNTVVEVHWSVTWPGDSRALSDLEDLWTRAQPLTIAGCEVLGLSPEDLLLHLCIHASFQHMFYTGLRPICDLDATIRCYQAEMDWRLVCRLARQRQWQTGVRLMLHLTQHCLHTRIPILVWQELQPAQDEAALAAAYRMLWTIDSDVSALPRNLATLWNRPNLLLRIWDLLKALVPNRFKIAKEYGLSARSPLVWLYVPRYKIDLLRKHSKAFRQLQRSDPATREMALNKSTLMDWLYQD